jgi:ribokinase
MKNNDSIVVVGSSNYDIVLKTGKIPEAGETVLAGGLVTGFGGKGANQAVTIARMGGKVKLFTCLGDDVFGKLYQDNFQKSGLDLDLIEVIPGSNNGIAIVNVDHSGRNNIVVYPGANSLLKPELVSEKLDRILSIPLIVTQLEIPVHTVRYLAGQKTGKNKLILNPSPIDPEEDYQDILVKTDILIPNEIELLQLAGVNPDSPGSIENAAEKVLEKGVKNLVVTMGEKGVQVVNKDINEHIPAEEVKVVDTEGAGDVFTGAFTYFYLKSLDILKAARSANKVAALSVTKYGAQKSIPSREEIQKKIGSF